MDLLKGNSTIPIRDLLLDEVQKKKKHKYKLTKNEIAILQQFDDLTLEAIIIHTLCVLYSNKDADIYFIKSSTVIKHLTRSLYDQASCLKKKPAIEKGKYKYKRALI